MDLAAKITSTTAETVTIGGYGIVWGGRDISGEHFTKDTDLWFDRISETPPLLYSHGLMSGTGRSVLGRVVTKSVDDFGLWVEAEVSKAAEYATAVLSLVQRGVLGFSSGSAPHLIEVDAVSKAIKSWPVVEFSLTPTPCEPRTRGVSELKELAEVEPAILAVLTSKRRGAMADSSFAYVDKDGGTHLPINDAAHVRAAVSRFGQTSFEDGAKKKAAARKILAAGKKFGIDIGTDTDVAKAAKGADLTAKALPDSVPVDSEDGDRPEGSYEDLIDDLNRAIQARFFPPSPMGGYQNYCYCHVVATWPEYCIAAVMQDAETEYWQVAYTLDADGEPVLGELREMDRTYVPALPEMETGPLYLQGVALTKQIGAHAERTKALSERRVKEGRVLSGANRTRLATLADAMQTALTEVQTLLTATEPQPAKAASAAGDWALQVELLKLSA